ncbi:MAG: ATP-binding protein [Deltaproteobacteria bacterium]|nr:ATP-binding protein [Deltaproteobacteria bacterium]
MIACECPELHSGKRIVLTGGPGAGKSAVLEIVRQYFCEHLHVLPEAASLLFAGGFPRGNALHQRQATQRAIFYVQRELEATSEVEEGVAIILCDRGTIDGSAYWPGPGDLWPAIHTKRADELVRYAAVIHLRTPAAHQGYNHDNPMRTECAADAATIDERIVQAWAGHPRRFFIESTPDFFEKAHRAIEVLKAELPECCRRHVVPETVSRSISR